MLFCKVWMARRATTSNLTKSQTLPLEKSRGSNSGLRFSPVFWMSKYKDYLPPSSSILLPPPLNITIVVINNVKIGEKGDCPIGANTH